MDHFSTCPQCRRGFCQVHGRHGQGVPTRGSLHGAIGLIVRAVVVFVTLVSLVEWVEYDPSRRAQNVLLTHADKVRALAISPDGSCLASGGYQGSVILREMDRDVDTVLEGKSGSIYGLAYSPDGSLLAGPISTAA